MIQYKISNLDRNEDLNGCVLTGNNGLHQQYNVEDQLHTANRMAVLANMVNQGQVPPGLGSDSSAAANITAANLANLAMRLGVTQANQVNNSSNPSTPPITNDTLSLSMNAMNAMRASMDSIRNMDVMRSSVMDMSSSQQSQQQQQEALRMQHAEALIRSQAETALRLAMSQALPQLSQHQQESSHSPLRHNGKNVFNT